MNTSRRMLLVAAGSAGLAGWPWPALAAPAPVSFLPAAGSGLLALASAQYAPAFIDAAQRAARLPLQRFEAASIDTAALAHWLQQRRGAVGIALLSASEHIFVNEALRLAGSGLLDADAPPVPLAALHAGAQAAGARAAGLVPLIFIA